MTNSFIRVPPDSTGKRMHSLQHTVDALSVEVPGYHLTDPVIPDRKQRVSHSGAAIVGFAGGEPSLDAFGNLKVSSSEPLAYYDFVSDSQDDLFWDRSTGGGALTYVPAGSYMNLSVGSASGDSAKRSTTRYHFYQPGTGNIEIQTLALGDTGKTGNSRKWGYGDEENALYWHLNGAWDNINMTNFSVNIRNSSSGSVVETSVARANWNGDKINGLGPSGFQMALDGRMLYWIDFAWLGVGPVRFGVMGSDGELITCHTFENPAGPPLPYMQGGSLPLFWENVNTASTSGTSEMRVFCGAVYSENTTKYNYWKFSDIERLTPATVTTDTPILSMRPALLMNTKVNRFGTYPSQISVFVSGGNVRIQIHDNCSLTGATWTQTGEGSTEGDIGATSMSNTASPFRTFYLGPGCHNIDLDSVYEANDEGYHVLGDGLSAQTFTIAATKIDGATVTVGAALTYRELR